jgi:hypothetical protein
MSPKNSCNASQCSTMMRVRDTLGAKQMIDKSGIEFTSQLNKPGQMRF